MNCWQRKREQLCIFVMALGLSLLFCSLYLVVGNVLEDREAKAYNQKIDQALEAHRDTHPITDYLQSEEFIPDYLLNPQMPMPVTEIDGYGYIGQLEIPALGLDLAIQDTWSYAGLKKSPCRYTGSAYLDSMTIVAHNYQAHFGGIKNLEEGDDVVFTDMDGNRFAYQVALVKEIDPYLTEQVIDSGYDLVLCTCTLGGATRIAVFCEKLDINID